MSHKRIGILAWGMPVISTMGGLALTLDWITHLNTPVDFSGIVSELGLVTAIFLSVLGALIITRQHGNRVGWLMIVAGLGNVTDALGLLLRPYPTPPTIVTPVLWFVLWLTEISWMFPLFAFFLIPVYFPSGRPPAGWWRWIPRWVFGIVLSAAVVASVSPEFNADNARWSVANPLAIPGIARISDGFFTLLGISVVGLVVVGAASLFVRYRRADPATRQQIKWLLVGVGLVVAFFVPFTLITNGDTQSPWLDLAFNLIVLTVPLSIAVAIFRYRLWDLDVVVNRALVYGPLTTLLAGIFAVLIAVTSALARQIFGAQSQALGAAVSAVVVAVIFQPMRTWLQTFVDNRFYPEKEDLASGLVEVLPEYWAFLNDRKLLRIAQDHVRRALGVDFTAVYLAVGSSDFKLVQDGKTGQGIPIVLRLSSPQESELRRKRVVANDDGGQAAGYVPIFIDRRNMIDLLGLLAVGRRENGRGYSGDDLKGMAELGGKIGLALNAIQLGVETVAEEAKGRVEPTHGLAAAEMVE